IGTLCALHPANAAKLDKISRAVGVELDLDVFHTLNAAAIAFREPSTQQSTYYDLSLVLADQTKFSDLAACWNSLGLAELESVRVIDTYE
ncbi:MAG: hypothetical protein IKD72_10725, partial [Clostridia bacterium]|nr:hypothetical protein [Clostridia bacterium]